MASQSRPYRDEGDYRRLRDLLIETHSMSVPPLNRHVGDLDWWLFRNGFDRIAGSRVWEDESGKLIGLAWPDGDEVNLFVHPERREMEAEMIRWAEQRRRRARPMRTRGGCVPGPPPVTGRGSNSCWAVDTTGRHTFSATAPVRWMSQSLSRTCRQAIRSEVTGARKTWPGG